MQELDRYDVSHANLTSDRTCRISDKVTSLISLGMLMVKILIIFEAS